MVAVDAVDAATSFNQFLTVQGAFQVLATLNLTSYMYPKSVDVFDGQFFDYIVVGGGTAGCVVATRLAEMDQEVLLVEAGGDPPYETTLPALQLFPLRSRVSWNISAIDDGISQRGHEGFKASTHQGKVLGGTSSLTEHLYSVGNRHDYDNWAFVVGDDFWNWENVFNYFKKSQNYKDNEIPQYYNENGFGTDGPVVLTKDMIPLTRDFVQAFGELGLPTPIQLNGVQTIGYAPTVFTIGDGVKQSTAQSYLARFKFDNLKVLKNALVTKVIINKNKTATGVKVQLSGKEDVTLNIRKEIIMSAGAFNTPKILLHSGIGPKAHLINKNIPVVQDLPVGRNLVDQATVIIIHDLPNLIINPIPTNPHLYPQPSFNGFVALDRKSQVPDYESTNFIDFPANHMSYCTDAYDYIFDICNSWFNRDNKNLQLWTILVNLHPKSRGYVELRSKNFEDSLIVNPRYLSKTEDIDDLADYIQDFMKIEYTEYFKNIGAKFVDPKFEECKNLPIKSREYWKCYVRYMAPQWHYSGTCSMGPVVDTRMRVRGIERLRIADSSVIPVTISGDMIAVVVILAEKLADIIMEDFY